MTEIVNLQSILCLPKGTEHFLSDVRGEFEQFEHVLKNGSGSVRRKVEEVMGNTLSNATKKELATLIYYPKEKMELIKKKETDIMSDTLVVEVFRERKLVGDTKSAWL